MFFDYIFIPFIWYCYLSPCFIIFVISVCISTSIDSIPRRIAPLHSISWTWSGCNYFFAKLSVAVLKQILLHILSGVDFGFTKFFSQLHFYWVATRICVLFFIGTKLQLKLPLPSADGEPLGIATGLAVMQYLLHALQFTSLY